MGTAGAASADILTSWNGTDYAIVTQWHGTWDQAREMALAKGWDLAAVTSQAEQNFLVSVLDNNHLSGEFWLGGRQTGTNLAPDQGWQWVTGEDSSYTSWAKGEPNDWHGINERYLGMLGSHDWNWNDEHANSNITGYVAERTGSPAPVPEPASMLLLSTGLLGLAGLRQRKGR
ncbi:MAG: C-type lectin domain-containing protein [Desulfobacteraceae bacterium]|nr:C-type lectin domain-containing protein [Desulfobacteraceae bacterium]